MSERAGRAPVLAAVSAAGAIAVFAVVFAGPVRVGPARWIPRPVAATIPPVPQTAEPVPRHLPRGGTGATHVIAVILMVVLALEALVLLVVLVRWVVRTFRGRRRWVRRAQHREDAATLVVADVDAASAPVVRRGIDRALQILDDDTRSPHDAVVAAWLGLEDAAVVSGVGRGAAETPTEYTTRIIRRFETDEDAAGVLVRLYQDVRFGARHVDEEAVVIARDALLRLRASWRAGGGAGAEPAGGGARA